MNELSMIDIEQGKKVANGYLKQLKKIDKSFSNYILLDYVEGFVDGWVFFFWCKSGSIKSAQPVGVCSEGDIHHEHSDSNLGAHIRKYQAKV